MWKKGTGEKEPVTRVSFRSFATTPLTVYGAFTLKNVRIPGSIISKYLEI
jgi:hypothetical protein